VTDQAAIDRVRANLATARQPVYDPTDPIQAAAVRLAHAETRPCDNDGEPDGERCTGTLTYEPDDVQAKCPICGGWTGRFAPARTPTPAAEHQGRLAAETKETP
jgi:hypothetical protein